MSKVTNILVAGIGGQGVMTAAEILCETALSLGYDVKKTEVAGMAQRGGVVTSHVRFGEQVLSPAIPPGEADILVAFEPAEGLRWRRHLRTDGVAMVNSYRQKPPVVNTGLFDYPEDPIGNIRGAGTRVFDYDAGNAAIELGDRRLINSIMLGAIADQLPFPAEKLLDRLLNRFRRKGDQVVDLNRQAFEAGRRAFSA